MKKISIVLSIWILTSMELCAFDLPTWYRAPLFQTDPTPKVKKWTTTFWARVATGDTHDSFDVHEHKTALFNAHGTFDIARLGLNLEDISAGGKRTTNDYWNNPGIFSNHLPVNPNDGKVIVYGRFKTTEFDFNLQQNLFWGLYVHAYLPCKDLKVDQIATQILGANSIGNPLTPVDTFLRETLPRILEENGFKNASLYDRFKKSGIGDLILSAGWQEYLDDLDGIVTSFGGLMQASVIVPTAAAHDQDLIFSIPLGYNDHIGFIARGALEGTLWDIVTIGAQAGATIFIRDDKIIRLKTHKDQNGWLLLEKGHANVDPNVIWDGGAYVKIDKVFRGFAVLLGYSFTRQESTWLHVEDDRYLKRTRADALALNNVTFISQDDYANSDARLRGWETQTIHFIARYDSGIHFEDKSWGPFFQLEYNYPIMGKYSFATGMFAGTLGVSMAWNF